MSQKKTFVTLEQLKEINKTYPTPYHLYDEKGIRGCFYRKIFTIAFIP